MKKGEILDYNNHLDNIRLATSDKLEDMGYHPLHIEGNYLYARIKRQPSPVKHEHVPYDRAGDVRI